MPRAPPDKLFYKLDDWTDGDPKTNDFNPGKYEGQPLKLIYIQYSRRLRFFKKANNWIYQIGDKRWIVYKPFPKAAGAFHMGVSDKSFHWHPKALEMEQYAKYLIDGLNPEWAARNDFVKL